MKGSKFLIITGMSGSGKTTVSRFLEDLGYYCMDNLPAKLIPGFVGLWKRKEVEIEKVALVIDIREIGFEKEFPRVLKNIRKSILPYLIFLDASNETLIKRFSETRRPHPITGRKSVMESLILERKRLAVIKNLSDEVIDTSSTSISELRKILARRFLERKRLRMQIVIISFGYKYGIPLDSDMVFDTRFLPNPFYVDSLRDKTGRSKSVIEYVLGSKETKKYMEELYRFVDYLMPKFEEEGKTNLTISIGCTGGKHRSVVLAKKLREFLTGRGYSVKIYHRDIFK